jgi:glucokinase
MKPLDGLNLTLFLEGATGLPAFCVNDANAIAMGEYIYGAGTDIRSFMVISIGTGLGSGLILDGHLWNGVNGFASEFGHITVKPDGLACPCGNKGCLEQYVSAGAIVRYAKELFPEHPQGEELLLDAAIVAGLARKGDLAARKAFETAGSWLGIGLASLANTLNLEAIIVCGGVSESLELLLPTMREELERRCFREIGSNLKIIAGTLADDAGLLGAAGMVRRSVV